MSVIFFLIGVGILVAGGFLAAFIWAVKSGQYDDDYTPSVRMLFDKNKADSNNSKTEKNQHSNNNKHETEQSNEPTPS